MALMAGLMGNEADMYKVSNVQKTKVKSDKRDQDMQKG